MLRRWIGPLVGFLVLTLAAFDGRAQSLTADFAVEAPSTCVDGACVVVFKALGSSPATDDTDTAINERKHLTYKWDFGNPSAGNRINGNRQGSDRNVECCKGYTAAHFYQGGDTGTRTITLTVIDHKNNLTSTVTHTVPVVSQASQWPTTQTICVNPAADADFTACDAVATGATHKNIGDTGYTTWDASVATNWGLNRSVLFKCGATYAATAGLQASSHGLDTDIIMIGGQGTGRTCPSNNRYTVTFGDFRLVGLAGGTGSSGNIIFTGGRSLNDNYASIARGNTHIYLRGGSDAQSMRDFLVYNWRMEKGDVAFGQELTDDTGAGGALMQRIWLVQSEVAQSWSTGTDNAAWGTQLSCRACGVLESFYDNKVGSHSVRSSRGYFRIVRDNTFQAKETVANRAILKFNGTHTGDCTGGCFSHDEYIGYNWMQSSVNDLSSLRIEVSPQSPGTGESGFSQEEVQTVTFEGNRSDCDNGFCTTLLIMAHDSLFTNFTCTFTGSGNGECIKQCGHFSQGTGFPPQPQCGTAFQPPQVGENNDIVGVTAYVSGAQNATIFLSNGYTNLRLENTFIYGPTLNDTTWINDAGNAAGVNTISHNVRQNGGTVPFLGNGTYNSQSAFTPVSGATSVRNQGIARDSMRTDALGLCRDAVPDVGSVDADAVACVSASNKTPAARGTVGGKFSAQ